MQAIKGLGAASVEAAVASLEELQEAMIDWGLAPPSEGWAAWSQNLNDIRSQAQDAPTVEGGLQESKALNCQQCSHLRLLESRPATMLPATIY